MRTYALNERLVVAVSKLVNPVHAHSEMQCTAERKIVAGRLENLDAAQEEVVDLIEGHLATSEPRPHLLDPRQVLVALVTCSSAPRGDILKKRLGARRFTRELQREAKRTFELALLPGRKSERPCDETSRNAPVDPLQRADPCRAEPTACLPSQCGNRLAARRAERRRVLQVVAHGFVSLRATLAEHARNRLVQLCAGTLSDAGVDRVANQRVMETKAIFAGQRRALCMNEPAARERYQRDANGSPLISGRDCLDGGPPEVAPDDSCALEDRPLTRGQAVDS
jgi:hypothetical protein